MKRFAPSVTSVWIAGAGLDAKAPVPVGPGCHCATGPTVGAAGISMRSTRGTGTPDAAGQAGRGTTGSSPRKPRTGRVRTPAEEGAGGHLQHRHHAADRGERGATWNSSPRRSRAPISPTSRSGSPGRRLHLDPTLQGRPVNAKALEVFEQTELADDPARLPNWADHVLFFSTARTARTATPSRRSWRLFQARHGIQVVPSAWTAVRCRASQRAPGQRHCHHPEGHAGARRFPGPALHRKDHAHRLRRALRIPVAGTHRHRVRPAGRGDAAPTTQRFALPQEAPT